MVRKIDGYLKWWHQNGFCGCGHRFESNRGYNKGRRYGAYFINLYTLRPNGCNLRNFDNKVLFNMEIFY